MLLINFNSKIYWLLSKGMKMDLENMFYVILSVINWKS